MINKLGFGFLRLPKEGKALDWAAINDMVDAFMAGGGSFFDTCYTYLDGLSEAAIRRCVVERKPRTSFRLCDKLPGYLFSCYEDCQKYLDIELERCGVDYFDVLMLHGLDDENYAIAQKLDQFRFLREKKAEGRARRIGFSFHGSADLLEEALTEHPEVDVVLLQINYLDWESEGIQSRRCYETALRHGKGVIVMEPVKGGTLAELPQEAEEKLLAAHPDWTGADWALRFVQSLPGVEVCLSGMGTLAQMQANIRPFEPLTAAENALLAEVRDIIERRTAIACTGCGYCVSHCPQRLPIPQYIRMYNELCRHPGDDWKIIPSYNQTARTAAKASACMGCRGCERYCPQDLKISEHMKTIAASFEE